MRSLQYDIQHQQILTLPTGQEVRLSRGLRDTSLSGFEAVAYREVSTMDAAMTRFRIRDPTSARRSSHISTNDAETDKSSPNDKGFENMSHFLSTS